MSQRNTIHCEQAKILSHDSFAGDQYILRVQAVECAKLAQPGQFAHITCHPSLPMRRPISIMRVSKTQGWVDFLYKDVGSGTHQLAARQVGEEINIIAPVGKPFRLNKDKKHCLLIGGGVGMPPMVFLAEALKSQQDTFNPFVLLGSEVPFPFSPTPSRFMIDNIPDHVMASMPLFEDWQIPSRLASLQDFPGCFQGYITELAKLWIDGLASEERQKVMIYSCGPTPMLKAVAKLAAEYEIEAQLSLEEHMACGIGGCAGCTVKVTQDGQQSMKRVCVDGPVFEASTVYPELYQRELTTP
jgi:dihydroorotate dehydrogenase electron transfer subunit